MCLPVLPLRIWQSKIVLCSVCTDINPVEMMDYQMKDQVEADERASETERVDRQSEHLAHGRVADGLTDWCRRNTTVIPVWTRKLGWLDGTTVLHEWDAGWDWKASPTGLVVWARRKRGCLVLYITVFSSMSKRTKTITIFHSLDSWARVQHITWGGWKDICGVALILNLHEHHSAVSDILLRGVGIVRGDNIPAALRLLSCVPAESRTSKSIVCLLLQGVYSVCLDVQCYWCWCGF